MTTMQDLQTLVAAFFDEFDEAFASFDGAVVAARYSAPYLAVRADGSSESFATGNDIAVYFQAILDDYHRLGCRTCRHRDLEVVPVGSAAVFATVRWELLAADAAVVTTWRESYGLVARGDKLAATVSMDHRP